jgi:hypothetical protein
MSDRGSVEYEDDDGNTFLWKRCEVPACENMICHRLSPVYCWPHAMSGGAPVAKRKDRLRPKAKETVQ